MRKSRMTRILIEGDPALLQRLSEQIEDNYDVEVVRSPEKSLVMTKSLDSVSRQPFYLGEVLVTECTVMVEEEIGFGVLMGEDAQRAYRLAVVDGAVRAGLPETAEWESLLTEEELRVSERDRRQYAQALKSRVNFDTMEEYHAKR